jgi:hypothetical protein
MKIGRPALAWKRGLTPARHAEDTEDAGDRDPEGLAAGPLDQPLRSLPPSPGCPWPSAGPLDSIVKPAFRVKGLCPERVT